MGFLGHGPLTLKQEPWGAGCEPSSREGCWAGQAHSLVLSATWAQCNRTLPAGTSPLEGARLGVAEPQYLSASSQRGLGSPRKSSCI